MATVARTKAKPVDSAQPKRRRIEYTRPPLYPKQLAAIFDEHRISVIEASTKSGKTSGAIAWLVEKALGGKGGQNFWWVAPVFTQADIAFRRTVRACPPEHVEVNLTAKTITLLTGSTIWFKSADHPDSLYGDDVHAAVIDEASRFKEDSWHAVRSTLTATRGPIRIIGNVRGRQNWFYRLARMAELGDPSMGYHKLVVDDAIQAGVLNASEVDDARRLLPEAVFRELYMAEASDDQGNPFGLAAIASCVRPLSGNEPDVWGWDLAKHQDWTVGVALDTFGHVCRFERFQLPWDNCMRRIALVTGSAPALVDSTGVGDPIVELLQKNDGANFEGYQFTAPSKQKLMEGLAVAIQSGSVGFPDGPIRVELEQFEYEYRRSSIAYSAPEGLHDDCVCALALAVMHQLMAERSSYDSSLKWVGDVKVRREDDPRSRYAQDAWARGLVP
jgi:hypothetical protein